MVFTSIFAKLCYQVLNAQQNLIVLILTVAVAVAALVVIFLYKDRSTQLKIAITLLGANLLTLILVYSKTKVFIEGSTDLTSLIYFAVPVCLALAIQGIWKDQQLVKNADRLR
jgi:uncharacterized membrane protein YhhN